MNNLLKGDRYQGDAKWPKMWEALTREQAEAMKPEDPGDENPEPEEE